MFRDLAGLLEALMGSDLWQWRTETCLEKLAIIGKENYKTKQLLIQNKTSYCRANQEWQWRNSLFTIAK